jgi:hypothetical protein
MRRPVRKVWYACSLSRILALSDDLMSPDRQSATVSESPLRRAENMSLMDFAAVSPAIKSR